MSIGINVHRCTNVRVRSTFKGNANSVTLEIERGDESPCEIVLFDLPQAVTDKLRNLHDEATWHHDDATKIELFS